jgi:hypothetical protein
MLLGLKYLAAHCLYVGVKSAVNEFQIIAKYVCLLWQAQVYILYALVFL